MQLAGHGREEEELIREAKMDSRGAETRLF